MKRELDALPSDMQARFYWIADLLADAGPSELGMPYIRPLGDKLWEMRLGGQSGAARAIYIAASRQRLVVLHVFIKKTQRTPERALIIARRRAQEIAP